jgi:hypothetical protein
MRAVLPVGSPVVVQDLGVFQYTTGEATCTAVLAVLTRNNAGAAPVDGVNYWTNLFIATTPPPDCGGLGTYNAPFALTNTALDTAVHEAMHNMGINHATNLHNESAGGTLLDWENWPYFHGSIGAPDENMDGKPFQYGPASQASI